MKLYQLKFNSLLFLFVYICFQTISFDVSAQQNSTTSGWRYFAIGGSLSAGFSNGGIRNSSQKAAFPALIAKQLGIVQFKLPLFENQYEQGSGSIKAIDSGHGIIFLEDAQSAIEEENMPKISGAVDNMAIPYMKVRELAVRENEPGAFIPSFAKQSYSHLNRLLPQEKEGETSYYDLILERVTGANFFTWELGIDDFTEYYKKGGIGQSVAFVTLEREGFLPENMAITKLVRQGAKGIVANVPDILSLPYFQIFKSKSILSSAGELIYIKRYEGRDTRLLDPNDILLPNDNVYSLFSRSSSIGLSPQEPLDDQDVIGIEEIADIDYYNGMIEKFAANNKIPLVDLKTLYARILEGSYISDDGVPIDPTFPGGNFFSSDGLFPTPVGQAIIANEFIKVLNQAYNTSVPLISVKSLKN